MKFAKLQRLAAIGIFVCAFAQEVKALDPDLERFVGSKLAEARAAAEVQTNKVPSFVWSFFNAIRVDDWETATNIARRLEAASGRYSSSNHETMSPALQSAIWPSISESIGAYEEFHSWDNKWLHRFGTNIIDSIPRGNIYFGGTDPGRFIISALADSQRDGRPFFILTQNQLADSAYLDYLRDIYGRKLYVPTTDDLQKAFEDYSEDAAKRMRSGQLKPGEDVHQDNDGHVEVSGQIAVMEINGLLAKVILEQNPGQECYIEESFPLDWMYPQLSPHGLIMQLHHNALGELDRKTVEKDMGYWKRLVSDAVGDVVNETNSIHDLCDFCEKVYLRKDFTGFKGDAAFAHNESAQKCFSKLRSSLAGLYVWRMEHARNGDERDSMRKAADVAFRQAFALCPYSPEAVFRYTKFLSDLNRPDDAILIAETSLRMGHPETDGYVRPLIRRLHHAD